MKLVAVQVNGMTKLVQSPSTPSSAPTPTVQPTPPPTGPVDAAKDGGTPGGASVLLTLIVALVGAGTAQGLAHVATLYREHRKDERDENRLQRKEFVEGFDRLSLLASTCLAELKELGDDLLWADLDDLELAIRGLKRRTVEMRAAVVSFEARTTPGSETRQRFADLVNLLGITVAAAPDVVTQGARKDYSMLVKKRAVDVEILLGDAITSAHTELAANRPQPGAKWWRSGPAQSSTTGA
ncbi:MAG: hypothetical protein Q7T55_12630 [Solirubrobacteraceae bacterium]|nr:hypothetical protein [Solirubrobacteraceae bacterium]